MSARQGLGLFAVAVMVSSCNFNPGEMLGGDPSLDETDLGPAAQTTVSKPIGTCHEYHVYQNTIGGCAPPELNQLELKATGKAGELELILHPDSKGDIPQLLHLSYNASRNWMNPILSETPMLLMTCDAAVVDGDHVRSLCKPPEGWVASTEHGSDPLIYTAGLGGFEIKSPNCLSSTRLQYEFRGCGSATYPPVHVEAPTFFIKRSEDP